MTYRDDIPPHDFCIIKKNKKQHYKPESYDDFKIYIKDQMENQYFVKKTFFNF